MRRMFPPGLRFAERVGSARSSARVRALVAAAPIALLAVVGARAEPDGLARLDEARGLMLEGYRDRAIETCRTLVNDPQWCVAAHVLWADIDAQSGRSRDALSRLQGIESQGRSSSEWHAAMASLLESIGEYEDALTHGREALRIASGHCRARYQLGALLERLGRRAEATETYEWFERRLHESLPERADDLTYAGRGFYRYSVLTRHEELVERCRYVLTEVFQEAFDFVDTRYYPARLAAAELLLEKHNLDEAREDFSHVLKSNGKVAGAYVGLARVALEAWEFDKAERAAEQALEIDPACAAAMLALGRTRMLERRYARAAEQAERILQVNPRHIEGLALLAAAQLRGGNASASRAAQRRLERIVPRSAVLHHELGVWLSAARQYDEAAAHFLKAIEYDPTWSEPRTELGLMYMQSGDEVAARETLDASWHLDGFNHETYNVLGLLDELEKFARRTSAHFVLKYDASQDRVIAPYLTSHLEALHADLTRAFDTTLDRPTIIEVFPKHSLFSIRITGRPWIHTVGACTGPVIAIDAPRKAAAITPFNWAQVLRHEFTHTVTLAATGNRIPHWMTEGLAVWAEDTPRPWEYCELLADAIRRDALFTLASIDWGFMRPRRPTDRSLAYAQSEWMIEYIRGRWGEASIAALLRAFRDHKTQSRAFREVLKITPAEFSREFAAWARKDASAWGLPLDPLPDETRLRARLLVNPRDAEALAQRAELASIGDSPREAKRLARQALEADASQPLALRVLAETLLAQCESMPVNDARDALLEEAGKLARRLLEAHADEPAGLRVQAIEAQHRKAWPEAIAAWQSYIRRRPGDPQGYRRLAGAYLSLERPAEALPILEKLHSIAPDEPEVARWIARVYRDRGDFETAGTWARRALDVELYDVSLHREAGEIFERTESADRAVMEFQAMIELEPDHPEGYERLAALLARLGRAEEARKAEAMAAERGGKVRHER